jgi:phosphoribosylamine--glycine ligase
VKVLVIGSGGREHALALALSRDDEMDGVHVAPGNPGTAAVASNHDVDPLDPAAVSALAVRLGVDLVVVGPEAPLVAGVADAVRAAGVACFGPSQEAARLEGSKAFAKAVMAAAEVPTAMAYVCANDAEVSAALDAFGPPFVVKEDGLAGGKGVVVTDDRAAALAHGVACVGGGGQVVVEEYLDGPEVSLFAVCDGEVVVPLLPAQDFKRLGDGGTGPNTGGMGSYAPLPWAPAELVAQVTERVLQPTVSEMSRRGTPFVGLLYAGLALTTRGLRVVEFNVRFGDPETQVLLPLMASSLSTLLHAAAVGRLDACGQPRWRSGAAVAVVVAAEGYPSAPRTGAAIGGLAAAADVDGVHLVHAGTAVAEADAEADGAGGGLVVAGGRVLSVVGVGTDVADARARAYRGVENLSVAGAVYRTDIAADV